MWVHQTQLYLLLSTAMRTDRWPDPTSCVVSGQFVAAVKQSCSTLETREWNEALNFSIAAGKTSSVLVGGNCVLRKLESVNQVICHVMSLSKIHFRWNSLFRQPTVNTTITIVSVYRLRKSQGETTWNVTCYVAKLLLGGPSWYGNSVCGDKTDTTTRSVIWLVHAN